MTRHPGIGEPVTTATDFALGVLTAVLGLDLLQSGSAPQTAWGSAFLAASAAALLGGTLHGFGPRFDTRRRNILWRSVLLLTGLGSTLLLIGAALSMPPGAPRTVLLAIASGKALVVGLWIVKHAEFSALVIDSTVSLALILAISVQRSVAEGIDGTGWIVAGVLVSVVAGAVQRSGVRVHRHLNHNDLYHLLQMVAAWLLYRGAGFL